MSDPPAVRWAPLRIPDYRRFLLGQTLAALALQAQAVAVGWQLYEATRDPLMLGFAGLAEVLPHLLCSLVGGHVADRLARRSVVLTALCASTLCALALLLLTRHGVVAAHPWSVFTVVAAGGVARAFVAPARTALAAELVPRDCYQQGVNLRTATFQAGSIAGPAVGGWVYALGGAQSAYAMTFGLLLAAVACIAAIRGGRSGAVAGDGLGMIASVREGLSFVFSRPVLLGAMSLDLFAVLFGGATAMLPAFAQEILYAGPVGLGWLRAAPAIGSLLMAMALLHHGTLRRSGPTLLWAVAAFGVCMAGFGLSTCFALSLVLLLLSGVFDQVSVIVRQTLIQTMTPMHLQGRVASVSSVFIASSNELGAFESGVAARLLGLVPSVVAGGAMTLAVVGAVAWRVPGLRRLDRIAEA